MTLYCSVERFVSVVVKMKEMLLNMQYKGWQFVIEYVEHQYGNAKLLILFSSV